MRSFRCRHKLQLNGGAVSVQRSRLVLSSLMLVSILTVLLSMVGFLPEDSTAQKLGWISAEGQAADDQ